MKKRILVVSSANMDFVMRMAKLPEAGQTIVESRSYDYVPGGKGGRCQFRPENAPADAGTICMKDCPHVDSCVYSTKRL